MHGEQALGDSVRGPLGVSWGHPLGMKERTRFIDNEVAHALGQGVEQIVLLGAGYDGRALRFGGKTTTWFEVDLPELLADKRRRLDALGIGSTGVRYVAADLSREDAGAILEAAGHDGDRPTLFVAEGLFSTLTLEAVASLCGSVRERAVPGSVLASTFEVSPELGSRGQAVRGAWGRVRDVVGVVRSEFLPGDAQKLYVVTGWRVTRSQSSPPGWFGQGARLLALAGEPRCG